ncbi:hypothetical protein [Mucilaginibacter polytrichastri]|nr:hypothetical protein [Mucilaginibacter polytrichastri]SFT24973.1 hypothetical protein SAMN04487890_12269 [Mucilaginibacter polytrichastri]
MESFTVMLEIYNLSMVLLVTPITNPPLCFRIRTIAHGPNAMTINRLPDLSWNAEDIQKKYFTIEIVQRLGALIELKKPILFLPAIH